MTVTFDLGDYEDVRSALHEAAASVSFQRIEDVLHKVEAAFQEQLDDEIAYMVQGYEPEEAK